MKTPRRTEPLHRRLLRGPEAHARVVVLLVRLVGAVGIADLLLEVVVVRGLVLSNPIPEGPLRVRVDVHLDRAGLDGVLDVLGRRAASAVEHEVHGLLVVAAELLGDELLRVVEDLRF